MAAGRRVRVIPPMAAPFDAAAAPISEGAFEAGAPLRPEAQRLPFWTAAVGAFGTLGVLPGPFGEQIVEQFQRAASGQDSVHEMERPATAESLTDLKPLAGERELHCGGERRRAVDHRPHVAHERILFEQHLRARRGQRTRTSWSSPRQEVIFAQIAEELAANGFEVSQMDRAAWRSR